MILTLDDLTALFSRHDPEGLIDEEDARNWDEYSPEAKAALDDINTATSEEQVFDVLVRVWKEQFNLDSTDRDPRTYLGPTAHEIWTLRR